MKPIFVQLEALTQSDDAFTREGKYSAEEVDSFEKKYNWNLPEEYKLFLREIGIVEYDYPEFGDRFWFIKPENIEAWSSEIFPESDNLFPEVLLIATSISGENFGFIKGSKELFVFDPECPSEIWSNEYMAKYSFEKWISMLVESKMETTW